MMIAMIVVNVLVLAALCVVAWLLWVAIELHRTELREMFTEIFHHQRKVIDTLEAILSTTPITLRKAKMIRARIRELKRQGRLMEVLGVSEEKPSEEASDVATPAGE